MLKHSMARLSLAALLAVASCSYYGSHKVLTFFGSEPERSQRDKRELEQVERDLRPGPQEYPYGQASVSEATRKAYDLNKSAYEDGEGRTYMGHVRVNSGRVPDRVTVEARGANIEVGDVSVIAYYTGGPGWPEGSYSAVLARYPGVRAITHESGSRQFEMRGLNNPLPREPARLEVWFKIKANRRDSGDTADVWVYFDGSSVGGYRPEYARNPDER